MTFLQEGGHREPRQPPVGRVVSGRQSLQGLAGLHAANVQGRDLDGLTRQLLVGQVVVQETVQSLVDLLQVHLFVLQNERMWSRAAARAGVEEGVVVMVEREDRDREGQVINGHATTFSEMTHGAAKVLSLFSHFLVLWSHAKNKPNEIFSRQATLKS